jgi:hypothetical protein
MSETKAGIVLLPIVQTFPTIDPFKGDASAKQ